MVKQDYIVSFILTRGGVIITGVFGEQKWGILSYFIICICNVIANKEKFVTKIKEARSLT